MHSRSHRIARHGVHHPSKFNSPREIPEGGSGHAFRRRASARGGTPAAAGAALGVNEPRTSIRELGRRLRNGETSAEELARHFLGRIEALDPALNAFRLVCAERAIASARAADHQLGAGIDLGPLHGIPYAAKDLYDVAGLPTSAGCRLLEDRIAEADATVVRRLARAGMVLLGKTNTVQFAYGGAGINHHHGTPHNPWHTTHHLPGGSSSGSGVAVGAGLAPMALGSDTGGSVRIPAAFCSTSGLKTTVGRVSRAGVYPLSATLDSVGPLTSGVEDAALVYQAMHGSDPDDETTLAHPAHDVLARLNDGVAGLRIAFAEGLLFEDVDPEVEAAVRAGGEVFEGLGATLDHFDFPQARAAQQLNPRGLVISAEAYAVNQTLVEEHFDDLDPIIAFRLAKGREIPAHEYLAIMRERVRLRAETRAALHDVDALLAPTVPIPPPRLEDADRDRHTYTESNLACLRNTAPGNLLDLCALSVPCGFTAKGLPIGLMIYAKPFDEATLLRVGQAFQKATDWHLRCPNLSFAGRGSR